MSPRRVAEPDIGSFLRSINVAYDRDYPERVRHFRPTAKCARLISSLSGRDRDRAYFIVAPYGSGKSIAASYLLHIIENRPEATLVLAEIEPRLRVIDPQLARYCSARRRSAKRGLVIPLHGHVAALPQAIRDGTVEAMKRHKLGREARPIGALGCDTFDEALQSLSIAIDKAANRGLDRVLIIWDEFGRHIESLISEGHTGRLADLQLLAEFAVRQTRVPLTLGLLLHQDLFNYAANLPQSVRSEWRKIEGRFKTIQYVDLSKEIYELVGDLITSKSSPRPPRGLDFKAMASGCLKNGILREFRLSELQQLLQRAYPVEPAALYALPRIAARAAQNERTLFSFIHAADLSRPIGPPEVFDYFSDCLRSDVGVGGTYKIWAETQAALERGADIPEAPRTLKTLALLGLGTNGQRATVSPELAEFAIEGFSLVAGAHGVLSEMTKRKIVLHRRHSNEVCIWHGADLDLRGALQEEKARQRPSFDLIAFLKQESPPPVWHPNHYNDDYHMRRFFRSHYIAAAQLQDFLGENLSSAPLPDHWDGRVLYLVSQSETTRAEAVSAIKQSLSHDRIIIAVPSSLEGLLETTLEVASLLALQDDQELVGSDPMILPEIRQMTDDARMHLMRLLDAAFSPSPNGPRWFYKGEEHSFSSERGLRVFLSEIMRRVYRYTPKFNNEMIVRHSPSATIINSRKKLEIGILERCGMENLGIQGDFPDASMFRTILLQPGLYAQQADAGWRFQLPSSLSDRGLSRVWRVFEDFFTAPSVAPKPFPTLLEKLRRPPYGLRNGPMPILLASALKTFHSAYSIRHLERGYLDDIRPSDIEAICSTPAEYELAVHALTSDQQTFLRALISCFASQPAPRENPDLIRTAWDTILAWRAELPAGWASTRLLSHDALKLRSLLDGASDPASLLLEEIPSAFAKDGEPPGTLPARLLAAKADIEMLPAAYRQKAHLLTQQAFAQSPHDRSAPLLELTRQWAACFPGAFIQALRQRQHRGFFKRLAFDYADDHRFLDALAVLFDCGRIESWSDESLSLYQKSLFDFTKSIEELAIRSGQLASLDDDASMRLGRLFADRIALLKARLIELVGTDRARALLDREPLLLTKEAIDG